MPNFENEKLIFILTQIDGKNEKSTQNDKNNGDVPTKSDDSDEKTIVTFVSAESRRREKSVTATGKKDAFISNDIPTIGRDGEETSKKPSTTTTTSSTSTPSDEASSSAATSASRQRSKHGRRHKHGKKEQQQQVPLHVFFDYIFGVQ